MRKISLGDTVRVTRSGFVGRVYTVNVTRGTVRVEFTEPYPGGGSIITAEFAPDEIEQAS